MFSSKQLIMKKIYLITTILFSNFIISQSICDEYNEGMRLYNEKKVEESIATLISVYEKKIDTSKCYRQAFNNIPYLYLSLYLSNESEQDQLNCIIWLNKILDSNLDDKEETGNLFEPYSNYKHRAAIMLSKMYSNKNEFSKSLDYLNDAQKKYKYQTFSAGSFEDNENKIALNKAEILFTQNKKQDAILILINKIFDDNIFYRIRDASSFTDKDYYIELREVTIGLIKEEIKDKDQFIDKLKKSIKKLKIVNEEIVDNKQYGKGYFYFDEYKFEIGLINIESEKELVDRILNNIFFTEINN